MRRRLMQKKRTRRRSNCRRGRDLHIWVDADACPGAVKEILYRAVERLHISMTLVANQPLRVPPSKFIRTVQVMSGFDVADHRIVSELTAGDLVITADIPLAADVLARGGHALNPRGEFYSEHNIAQALSMRDFLDQLRSSGVETGGPAPFGAADTRAFARELDRFLQKQAQADGAN